MEIATKTDFMRLENKVNLLLRAIGEKTDEDKTIWTKQELFERFNIGTNQWFRARRKLVAAGMTMQGRRYYLTPTMVLKYFNQI